MEVRLVLGCGVRVLCGSVWEELWFGGFGWCVVRVRGGVAWCGVVGWFGCVGFGVEWGCESVWSGCAGLFGGAGWGGVRVSHTSYLS